MIVSFLRERLSWIMLVAFLHLFISFVAFIDTSIPLVSVLYILFLSFGFFLVFLFFRYKKETEFYRHLKEREKDLDLSTLPKPDSPFEELVAESLRSQSEHLKQDSHQHMQLLEKEKDDLLAWIHEVKTPLTAMKLMVDRMEDEKKRASLTYEWLRIHLLLDQQLHQKRIPFIEKDLYMEETDLEELIYTEIKTLQSWCIQKGIGFDLQLGVKEVLTDAKWLSFILRQLLTNSVKYSRESEIEISSFLSEGQTVLRVKDHGRGIALRDLPRIFDKGFTSTTDHQDHASTGMGLYLARKAADTLHIHIDVTSTLGTGTTFTLTFPKKNEFVRVMSK
ncbi:sensor histidine kinase [Bacillus haimaensis]|uniref:sensor histidine kinase n=1 Tax=Bacillus haimaensis TaxID=3160967 RepID=UPI003AA7E301